MDLLAFTKLTLRDRGAVASSHGARLATFTERLARATWRKRGHHHHERNFLGSINPRGEPAASNIRTAQIGDLEHPISKMPPSIYDPLIATMIPFCTHHLIRDLPC